MRRIVLHAAALAALTPAAAVAHTGAANDPIPLKMKRGTDTLVVRGVLRQGVDSCAYSFKASAGQKLYWTETGAAARMGLVRPDGESIDPGLPSPAELPERGTYKLLVSPDLMADGAFGRFTLKLRIPPRR
jgi:hypothetical protein